MSCGVIVYNYFHQFQASINRSISVGACHFQQELPKKIWKLGKLNHVAIAVPNLEKATALYRDVLGATVSKAEVCIQ